MADRNDGKSWSKMDLDDLKAVIEDAGGVEEAAQLLCHTGTVKEVRRKARELGLVNGEA